MLINIVIPFWFGSILIFFNFFRQGHPLDFQCHSKMMAGWPRLLLEIFKLDEFGRNDVVGYGMVDLPKMHGSHELECNTWRPRGDRKQEYNGE